MLLEYYTIRLKDAEPGKGLLHTTQHYDEIHSAIKHFKEKHPGKAIVAYKHEIKKGPMGATFKRKAMFGKSKPVTEETLAEDKEFEFTYRKDSSIYAGKSKYKTVFAGSAKEAISKLKVPDGHKVDGLYCHDTDTYHCPKTGRKKSNQFESVEIKEATRSFKTLMRSIEDKKSIKNLKVPSPSERNPDGSMKPKEEPKKLEEAAQVTNKHLVMCTVSDPNHTMVTKRKEKVQKRVKVTATGRDEAKAKAEAFYKKQGYKVHDVEYHSPVKEPTHVQQGAKVPRGYEMTSHGHVVKKTKGEGALGEAAETDFTETKHTHEANGDKYEVRGEKYPNLRRPRHAIFKNGAYHSMAGTLMDARARVNHIASTR
jgi:hypothetical protein